VLGGATCKLGALYFYSSSVPVDSFVRGGIAATVHNNKIYMTGGKYGGTPNHPDFRYDNDVWTLEKK
jgi:hypothetical protein